MEVDSLHIPAVVINLILVNGQSNWVFLYFLLTTLSPPNTHILQLQMMSGRHIIGYLSIVTNISVRYSIIRYTTKTYYSLWRFSWWKSSLCIDWFSYKNGLKSSRWFVYGISSIRFKVQFHSISITRPHGQDYQSYNFGYLC